MSKWIYDGYTKVKIGSGRHARYVTKYTYKCPYCGLSVRVERLERPPRFCQNCNADMNDDTP